MYPLQHRQSSQKLISSIPKNRRCKISFDPIIFGGHEGSRGVVSVPIFEANLGVFRS